MRRGIRNWTVLGVSVVSCVAAVFMPSGRWSPPPESESVRSTGYNSRLSPVPETLPFPSDSFWKAEIVSTEFKYKVLNHPEEYGVLVSTSSKFNEGMQVTIDNLGNISLIVQSVSSPAGLQLIKISGPQELGNVHSLKILIDKNLELIELSLDGRDLEIAEVRPDQTITISHFVLFNNLISLGGVDDRIFSGEITEFTMAYGRPGIHVKLVNFKLFLMMAAIIFLGVFLLQSGLFSRAERT